MDGIEGARTWCGHGVFNHNLVKIARLMAEA
jgi:IS5 family transposase